MINYRVQNLEGLLDRLRKDGVTILDEVAAFDYGKFVHIMDPDSIFTQMGGPTTK